MGKKKIILFIMMFYYIYVIFSFSVKPAAVSSEESGSFTRFIYNVFYTKISFLPDITLAEFKFIFEPVIRKIAHVFNFFILSQITSFYVKCYFKKIISVFLYSALLCLMVAIFDELLQLTSVGRACRLFDVYIDFLGATLGVFLFAGCFALFENKKGRFCE